MIRIVHIRTSNLDEYLILIKLLRNVENITSIYYLRIFPYWIDQAYTLVDNTDNTIILQDNIGDWWICFVRNPCDSSGCCLDCLFFSWIDQKDFMLAGLYPLRKYQSTGGNPLKQGNQGSNVSNILKYIKIRRSPDRFSKATHFGEIIYSTYSWLNRLSPLLRHAKKAHQFSKSSTKQIPFFGSSILWVRSNP